MKKLLVLLMICCLCTACGTKEETVVVTPEQEVEVTEETEMEEAVEVTAETESETATKIVPVPVTVDLNDLSNCTLAISFEEGDAYVDETGAMQLDVIVYTYDLYDMDDISNLKEGDTITIQGNDVLVESIEVLESGLVFINGGMENGGYDLWNENGNFYFEHGFNDMKFYNALGEATLKVSEDFEFVDSSDLEKGEVTYHQGDLLTADSGIVYNFTPNNTSVVVENGQVVSMKRIFTP